MRSVAPVSLTAAGSPTAMASSLEATTTEMATGAGASGTATGVGSGDCVEGCKLAGSGIPGAEMDFGSVSSTEASESLFLSSVVGSGIGIGSGLGVLSGVGLGVGSHTTGSGTAVMDAGAGKTVVIFAGDCFGGIAGTAFECMDGIEGRAGGLGLSRGVSGRPVVASVSCRSLITSRSFPHFLSALPVLPAPESTSSWAKLSMLSRILSSSAPSSSSPTTDSLFSIWGGVRL